MCVIVIAPGNQKAFPYKDDNLPLSFDPPCWWSSPAPPARCSSAASWRGSWRPSRTISPPAPSWTRPGKQKVNFSELQRRNSLTYSIVKLNLNRFFYLFRSITLSYRYLRDLKYEKIFAISFFVSKSVFNIIVNSAYFRNFFFVFLTLLKELKESSWVWGSLNFFDISPHSKTIKKRKENFFLTGRTIFSIFFSRIFVLVCKNICKKCNTEDKLVLFFP